MMNSNYKSLRIAMINEFTKYANNIGIYQPVYSYKLVNAVVVNAAKKSYNYMATATIVKIIALSVKNQADFLKSWLVILLRDDT